MGRPERKPEEEEKKGGYYNDGSEAQGYTGEEQIECIGTVSSCPTPNGRCLKTNLNTH